MRVCVQGTQQLSKVTWKDKQLTSLEGSVLWKLYIFKEFLQFVVRLVIFLMSVTKYLAQTASQKTELLGLGVRGFYLSLQERHGRAHGSRRRVCPLLHNSRHEAEKTDQNRLAAGKVFKGLLPAICFCQTGSSPPVLPSPSKPINASRGQSLKALSGEGVLQSNHDNEQNSWR